MEFNIIKVIYEKPIANITLNSEKLKFFFKSGTVQDAPICHFYQHIKNLISFSCLVRAIRQEKEIKSIQTGKEEIK